MTKRVNFLLYGTLLFFFNQVRFLLLYFLHFSFQEFIIWQLLLSAAMGLNFVWCSFFFILQTFGAKDPRVTHMKLLCCTKVLGWFQNAYYLDKRYATCRLLCLKISIPSWTQLGFTKMGQKCTVSLLEGPRITWDLLMFIIVDAVIFLQLASFFNFQTTGFRTSSQSIELLLNP